MELREALAQIDEMRLRLARTEVFWGYRAAPMAFSGLVALAAAAAQAALLPDAAHRTGAYLALWIGAAGLSALVAVLVMLVYYRRVASPLKRQTAWVAAEQFAPSLAAGALLTFAVVRFAPDALALLPGLWQIVFSLGLFASCRSMPRPMAAVAVLYLLTGTLCIAWARGPHAFSPWAMGGPFGAGQLAAAAILRWTVEKDDGRPAA